MMLIQTEKYKNQAAIVLDNKILQATIIPQSGAKIASLYFKPLDEELLLQNDSPNFIQSNYGDCFEDGECAGMDDMFPTIDSCNYPSDPWKGIQIPDHGEVWSQPWECEIAANSLHCKFKSNTLPYILEKKLTLENNELVIKYKLTNNSDHEMEFLWAAHPLFKGAPGMHLSAPEGMNKIINANSQGKLPEFGKSYNFPYAQTSPETTIHLAELGNKNKTGFLKYYFSEKMKEGWCKLDNPKTNIAIKLIFPKEKVPYLGVWINEGGWKDQYCFAPEPATGAMDSLQAAKKHKMNSVIAPNSTEKWYLKIQVSSSKQEDAEIKD